MKHYISVDDRLPEHCEVGYGSVRCITEVREYWDAQFKGGKFYIEHSNGKGYLTERREIKGVTHWCKPDCGYYSLVKPLIETVEDDVLFLYHLVSKCEWDDGELKKIELIRERNRL